VYHHVVDDVAAFVLAGGKSTRMGEDKAFLKLEGKTLLARALELAHSVARDVWIAGDAAKFRTFGRVVEDFFPNRGPLAGIHSALRSTTSELNLMLAVDLPFVETKFLEYLIFQSRQSRAAVTVPRAVGGLQPLCAVYRREFGELAEQSLLAGRNKIDALFAATETRVVEEAELRREGFSSEMFRNLNTPQELEAAKVNQGTH
jgi:molybdopterin-guanine dinucleotide biosynthesis protein A